MTLLALVLWHGTQVSFCMFQSFISFFVTFIEFMHIDYADFLYCIWHVRNSGQGPGSEAGKRSVQVITLTFSSWQFRFDAPNQDLRTPRTITELTLVQISILRLERYPSMMTAS